jgi:hypothetical protein
MSETAAPDTYLIVEEYVGVRKYWIRARSKGKALQRWAGIHREPPPIIDEVVKVTAVGAVPYVPGVERKSKRKPDVKRQKDPA